MKASVILQLIDIYYFKETWHKNKLPVKQAFIHFETAFFRENLIVSVDNKGNVLGYMEYWRINYEQLGRLLCKDDFLYDLEDTSSGNICYFANTWIDPRERKDEVFRQMKHLFFVNNKNCEVIVGEPSKRPNTVKIYKKPEVDKWAESETAALPL